MLPIPTATELLEFLGFKYDPEHEFIPGVLSISYRVREFGIREKKASWTFRYDQISGKVYFIPTPESVELLIGKASGVDEAVKAAQEFLESWLYNLEYHVKVEEEIQRLYNQKKKRTK